MSVQPLTRQYADTRQQRQAENGTPWPGSAPQTAPPYGRPALLLRRTAADDGQRAARGGLPGGLRGRPRDSTADDGEIGRRPMSSDGRLAGLAGFEPAAPSSRFHGRQSTSRSTPRAFSRATAVTLRTLAGMGRAPGAPPGIPWASRHGQVSEANHRAPARAPRESAPDHSPRRGLHPPTRCRSPARHVQPESLKS